MSLKVSRADLDIPEEVSELHVVADNKVCVEALGGGSVLLLEGGAVADPGPTRTLLHMRGGRGLSLHYKGCMGMTSSSIPSSSPTSPTGLASNRGCVVGAHTQQKTLAC